MPRPNKRRDVLAEDNLARRIAAERDARGWTNDGLAKRMTDVGCAMTGSAIFKIEKGEPRRRIVVDELVAFGKVFGIAVDELLLPPEVSTVARVTRRAIIAWSQASDEADAAAKKRDDAWLELQSFVAENPGALDAAESVFASWADATFAEEHREGARAYRMWELTGDEVWADVMRAEVNRGQHPQAH